jgi:hypothetical protein
MEALRALLIWLNLLNWGNAAKFGNGLPVGGAAAVTPKPERPTWAPEIPVLLKPEEVQRALKLSSRRAARDLIVGEMQHVVVGRTPMTSILWLAEWLESRRRSPRAATGPAQVAETPPTPQGATVKSRRASSHLLPMPSAKNRRKAA